MIMAFLGLVSTISKDSSMVDSAMETSKEDDTIVRVSEGGEEDWIGSNSFIWLEDEVLLDILEEYFQTRKGNFEKICFWERFKTNFWKVSKMGDLILYLKKKKGCNFLD